MSEPRHVTEIRASLHEGGVYLTFSGDEDSQYRFAKIVALISDEMWVKLFHEKHQNQPEYYPKGEFSILLITVNMFLAWGPPKFPIFVIDEPVTESELSACDSDRPRVSYSRMDPDDVKLLS